MLVSAIFYVIVPRSSDESAVADPRLRDRSVAVLPFKNLGDKGRSEYFSEGVAEAIRTGLSKIADLRVISRTSVEQYRIGEKPARVIARELGVAALLEGTIQRSGDKIRIDVRLIDGVSEGQLWAETYDREFEDVFAIQTDISQQVATELNAKLSADEKMNLADADTRNPKAYDLYLQGVYEYRTYTNSGAHNAIKLLSQAIALDSNYARAYAFLANSYIGLATIWGAELTAIEALERGKPLIEKALRLNPTLVEAHMLMGFYLLYHDWNFSAAETSYKLGITSNHPDGLAMYIDYLNFMSRHEEALALTERLNSIDPYYPNSRMMLSLYYNGKIEEALRYAEARLKIFSNYNIYDGYGFLLLNSGRYVEAIANFQNAIALEGIRYPRILGWMGAAYARGGQRTEALKIINELKERQQEKEGGSICFFIAVVYAALGENATAITWLTNALEQHDMEMPWLMTEPQFFHLHGDPAFATLARKMGFVYPTSQSAP
jgi:TolB-like protein